MNPSFQSALIRTGEKGKKEKGKKKKTLFKGKLPSERGWWRLNKTALCDCCILGVRVNLKIAAQAFMNWTDSVCPAGVGFVVIIDSESSLCASLHPRDVKWLTVLNYPPNLTGTLLVFPLCRAWRLLSKISCLNTHTHLPEKGKATHCVLKQTRVRLLGKADPRKDSSFKVTCLSSRGVDCGDAVHSLTCYVFLHAAGCAEAVTQTTKLNMQNTAPLHMVTPKICMARKQLHTRFFKFLPFLWEQRTWLIQRCVLALLSIYYVLSNCLVNWMNYIENTKIYVYILALGKKMK